MHKTLSTHTTFLVAIFATVAATAYAMYLTYETHSSIDAVAIPAHYLKSSDPTTVLIRRSDE